MHALSSHTAQNHAISRLAQQVRRLLHSLASDGVQTLPAEMHRLPDRLLRDVGVDRRMFVSNKVGAATPPDLLHSPHAMVEFLAITASTSQAR